MPLNCAMPFRVVSGGVSGLFLGRELDARRRALAPRAGGVLTFRTASEAVAGEPLALDVRDTLLVVASDSGAQLYTAGRAPVALRRRGVGLAGMRQVALRPEQGTLVFGTGSALWETPLLTGVASRLAGGAVTALAVGDGWVASGSGRGAVCGGSGGGGTAAISHPPRPGARAQRQRAMGGRRPWRGGRGRVGAVGGHRRVGRGATAGEWRAALCL
jgi:hypothetical protein